MNYLRATIAAIGVAAILVGCSSSTTHTSPDSAATKSDSADTIRHLDWPAVEAAVAQGAILVDARRAESFQAGHIAGAINIPVKSTDAAVWGKLPADKNTPVITYCGGPACSLSMRAAKKCQELGFTDVAEYKGGYPQWKTLTAAAGSE